MRNWFVCSLLLLSWPVNAELSISDAWIKHLPAAVPVRAGYMTLKNASSTAVTVQSVHSEMFAHIEIHRSVEQDGMMSMEPVPVLTVEANSTVRLEPGGLHLMLMRPVSASKPGDIIGIKIAFDDGSELNLDMEVRN